MSNELTKIQRKFDQAGYYVKVKEVPEILTYVNHFPGSADDAINLLLEYLGSCPGIVYRWRVSRDDVSQAIRILLEGSDIPEENPGLLGGAADGEENPIGVGDAIQIINAFDVPKFRYDRDNNTFYKHMGELAIHGDASAKHAMYKDRFLLLSLRLSRDTKFCRPAFESDISVPGSCEISPIQSVVESKGRRCIMGLISQLEDGRFSLEDLTAKVGVDLSNADIKKGLFSENTIVLAEGEMLSNGIFQVKTCEFPPLEDREKSIDFLTGVDLFGGRTLTEEEKSRLLELETRAVNDMFVILSDIWLDSKEKTMENLARVLDGYENADVTPSLFVFMGNFCSQPCNLSFKSFSDLRVHFGELGHMIASHQRLLEHSKFLFLPGPDDLGPSTALPRCPLPKYITQELQKHLPMAIFSSNPCRMKFYTQEIIFFRQDLLYSMCRSCVVPPLNEKIIDPFEHLVATITHQSHLCPLPLSVQPIIWNYDHALHLYPTPHTVVLGDKSEQKTFKDTGITCFNVGSFSNDGKFVVYRPGTRDVELSSLETFVS